MSVFKNGPVTFTVAEAVKPHRLVQLTENGVKHAGAAKAAFGAVSVAAAPEDSEAAIITTAHVAVYSAPHTVMLEIDGADSTVTAGAALEVGAEGKAKAATTGVVVAYAIKPAAGGRVQARLVAPGQTK